MSRLLDVYLGGAKAGTLRQDEAGALSYAYEPGYLAGREPRAILGPRPQSPRGGEEPLATCRRFSRAIVCKLRVTPIGWP